MSSLESHAKKLGWFLCWAVVFADIGTSVYYVPGILYGSVHNLAGFFVSLTSLAFMLLVLKYIDITDRYAEGGGVVTVATHAFGPWLGALGGMFITVDYFLTAAISSVSGFEYLASFFTQVTPYVIALSVIGLILLGILNTIGIKESAGVTAVIAVGAFIVDVVLFLFVLSQVRPEGWKLMLSSFTQVKNLGMWQIVTGFAGSFLAFSGLESISQLSPAMALPRKKVATIAMVAVILTILITSPTLTLFSTNILTAKVPEKNETILENVAKVSERQDKMLHVKDPKIKALLQHQIDEGNNYSGQFISELGAQYGGTFMKIAVVITASILLLFASNTAIIGAYHVFIALSRQNFLPHVFQMRNQKFGTPHFSILLAVVAPIIIVIVTNANLNLLGDLYAFGLLGAFGLSSTGLDIVRWKEGHRKSLLFILGIITSIIVIAAWGVNLYSKPLATIFGGTVTIIGMIIAYIIHTYFPHREFAGRLALTPVSRIRKGQILVPVFDEFDPTLFTFAAHQAKAARKAVVLLYIREFTDILQTVTEQIDLDEDAEEFLLKGQNLMQKEGITPKILYDATDDIGDSINEYRKKLTPSITIISPEKQSKIMEFIKGDIVRKVFKFKNGSVLIHTGNSR